MAKKKYWKAKRIDGFQPVMIDLDVYKAIEDARESFSEAPNTILRRLLRLDRPHSAKAADATNRLTKAEPAANGHGATSLAHGDALPLPDGSELRAAYCGVTVTGPIRDGCWEVEGSRFTLPSARLIASLGDHAAAASDLRGWCGWEIRLPGVDDWRPLVVQS